MRQQMWILTILAIMAFIFPTSSFCEEASWKDFLKQQVDKIKQQQTEQQQENKKFRETLKDLSPDAKMKAVIEHHKARQENNKIMQDQLHKEKMEFLERSLAANKKLTDEQKAQLKSAMNERYRENVAYRDKQNSANLDFFQKIADDKIMTPKQKREALKKHLAQQQKENNTHRKKLKDKLGKFQLDTVSEENKSEPSVSPAAQPEKT